MDRWISIRQKTNHNKFKLKEGVCLDGYKKNVRFVLFFAFVQDKLDWLTESIVGDHRLTKQDEWSIKGRTNKSFDLLTAESQRNFYWGKKLPSARIKVYFFHGFFASVTENPVRIVIVPVGRFEKECIWGISWMEMIITLFWLAIFRESSSTLVDHTVHYKNLVVDYVDTTTKAKRLGFFLLLFGQ